MMKIGLVQAPSLKDAHANLKIIERYAKEAKNQGCEVICFPECFLTGYAPEESKKLALSKNCEAIRMLSEMSIDQQIDILAGFMESEDDDYYITHGIFKANGKTDFYRKTHLGEKESLYFSGADMLPVFNLSNGVKFGIQLCVEIHFPEITKTLSLRGAEVVFAPHAVPKKAGGRKDIWTKIIPARSYDNRVYMACCNQWDAKCFGGGCLVTNPRGDVVAEYLEDNEKLLLTEIDIKEVERYHQENPGKRYRYYPSKGRAELYE